MINIDNKDKWKSFERYIQYRAYLSYNIDNESTGIFPKNNLYPSDTLYPKSSIQRIDLLLDTISMTNLEEIDVTTSSIPANELTLKVSDENGLFDEFGKNSILKYLDKNTKIKFYVMLDELESTKVQLFEYDFDSAQENDDKTATLKGYSFFKKLTNIPFVTNTNNNVSSLTSDLYNYFASNYDLKLNITSSSQCYSNLPLLNNVYETLYDVIWELITNTTNGFWINDRYNYLKLVNRKGKIVDTITKDHILNKVKVTKELNLDTIIANNTITEISTSDEKADFDYEYEGTFINNYGDDDNPKMALTISSSDFKLNEINNSDFTLTNCNISSSTKGTRYICLILTGTVDTTIKVKVTKNISKLTLTKRDKYVIGKNDDTYIQISSPVNPLGIQYYNEIINTYPINTHIEAQIVGLPYLELGDVIAIETEYGEKIINLTKIETVIDNGFKMNIEGYSTDYDGLFPSDTLYPSNTLYPNMRKDD